MNPEVGEHSFFSEASASNRGLHINTQLDNTWPDMQSEVSSFPQSKPGGDLSMWQNDDYPQHSFFSEFNSGEPAKQEGQSLRPFLDEWPENRDSWSALEDKRSNQTSFFLQPSYQYPFQWLHRTSQQVLVLPTVSFELHNGFLYVLLAF
ncbi:Origin recognition complex subunit 3, putative isoform 1 [Hibiscus syriacus]|uniref:Origin recognition complex subunit 3, putative isoform 1 n=1 Tax=Hibiscus syriacus TaxID=106335 RepID=A0A6A3A800_HIBSY|nr:Origin recognition complex subunit 3, putative isoform 1 [Hibiscus syriacus]